LISGRTKPELRAEILEVLSHGEMLFVKEIAKRTKSDHHKTTGILTRLEGRNKVKSLRIPNKYGICLKVYYLNNSKGK
jgi:DNA-binding MarR family transcriptional regulator